MLRYAATSVFAIVISSTAIEAARSGKQHELDAFSYAVGEAFSYSVEDEFPALLVSTDESDQSDQPTLSEAQSSLRPTYFPTSSNNNLLTFYAIGDTPYTIVEECLIPHELGKLSASDGRFLVHLGDIKDGKLEGCPQSMYENIATIFESSPMRTFFIVGDNEWLDCGGEKDVDESFTYWDEHLLRFHERTNLDWPPFDAFVTRHTDHPEFFSFILDNVLFLGQGLPPPQEENMPSYDEWESYLDANLRWTREHFIAQNAGTRLRAAVIFGHNMGGPAELYFADLKSIALSYSDIPILVMEDHHWFAETTFWDVPNLYKISLDDTVTPTAITIDTNARKIDKIFRYDRRCPCSTGHRPTNLLTYSDGECKGVCDTNILCAGDW